MSGRGLATLAGLFGALLYFFAPISVCAQGTDDPSPAQTDVPQTDTAADAADADEETTDAAPEQAEAAGALLFDENDSGEDILTRAQNIYEYGDYKAMVDLLAAALLAKRFTDEQLIDVHRLLGIGYFILQNRPKAREHFLRLLTRNPKERLDPVYVPPIIIEFFEKIREDNREMLDAIMQQRQGQEEAARQQPAPPARTVRLQYNPYFVNFIPFGAGQFQNGDNVKGTLFLTSQMLMLGLNVAAYFVAESLQGPDGYYSPGNTERARQWRIVQYSALGAMVALMIGGTVDAVLNWEEFSSMPVVSPVDVQPDQTPDAPPDNGGDEPQRDPSEHARIETLPRDLSLMTD